MTQWWMIGGMMLLTLATRASFLVFGQHMRFPPRLQRALHYVPVAVLSALIAPMALAPAGSLAIGPGNPYLVGTLVAGATAALSRKTLPAILLSFAVYGAMRYFV
ncbi:AzlD domain-containing protein [Paludibacterium yongneupense]|uniref:AzlD domain-containing protein n=1 Tax=Paludibacterium yongneupense TaxID=400061 RepID=UPI0003F6E2C3|nr:AzlD domain-containing protein [Paludibacterium yongneupense]